MIRFDSTMTNSHWCLQKCVAFDSDRKTWFTKAHIDHSSEMRGLCLMKCSSEMLQNLPYFWNMKTHILFFCFSFPPVLSAPFFIYVIFCGMIIWPSWPSWSPGKSSQGFLISFLFNKNVCSTYISIVWYQKNRFFKS